MPKGTQVLDDQLLYEPKSFIKNYCIKYTFMYIN